MTETPRAEASPFWPARVPRGIGPLPPSLHAALRDSALRWPARPAIHFYGQTIRYGALLERVEALAAYLQRECGVGRGDPVILYLQNSPHYVIAFYAVMRAGGVAVPVNPMNRRDELAHIAADSGARVAIVGIELQDIVASLDPMGFARVIIAAYGRDLPADPALPQPEVVTRSAMMALLDRPWAVAWEEACAERRAPAPDVIGPDDCSIMPYTSGTTGAPKACVHTHRSALFTAVAQSHWYGFGPDSVLSAFMPLFHVAGMQASMNAGLFAGAALVILARWDRDLVAPLFLRHGVTFWSAAPTMVIDVLAAGTFTPHIFDSVRILTGGGAPLPDATAATLEAAYGLRFVAGYGMSETMSPTHINPVDRPKTGSIGLPIYETWCRIVDPDTLDDLPDGETGEIIVAGPQIMQGYWRRPEEDAAAFVEQGGLRFLRTGDLGYRDAEGYYFLVDRLKRMINVSGYKVWPAECEGILFHHPAIRECCVVAAPDSYRGETVRVYVVPRDGQAADAAEIERWARERMAPYKVPRQIMFRASLPRTATNKTDWRALQQEAREEAAEGNGGRA
jgi:fatty-acyl-CoA synthase